MWIIILLFLLTVYLLLETIIPSLGTIGAYVVRPLLWLSLGITALLLARQQGRNVLSFTRIRHWYLGKTPTQAGFLLGGFHVSILIIVGIFTSFGNSPYSLTPTGILINSFYVGSMIIGLELARSYLVNGMGSRKQLTLIFLITTLIFMFIQISPDKFGLLTFSDPAASLKFLGNTLITSLAYNLLATYLAYLGGATASMAYTGVFLAFEWFSPILPTPHWTLNALVGTIAPAIGYIILQDSLLTPRERRKMRRKQRGQGSEHFDWTIVAIISLFVVFFSFGYLGATPTVIYSGSMTPTYHVGDIVLIDEDIDPETLEAGDIVQYVDFDNTSKIIHRIDSISVQNNKTYYLTKGDANDAPDFKPITKQRIVGKPIFSIPKLGWVQIIVKTTFRSIGLPI